MVIRRVGTTMSRHAELCHSVDRVDCDVQVQSSYLRGVPPERWEVQRGGYEQRGGYDIGV